MDEAVGGAAVSSATAGAPEGFFEFKLRKQEEKAKAEAMKRQQLEDHQTQDQKKIPSGRNLVVFFSDNFF